MMQFVIYFGFILSFLFPKNKNDDEFIKKCIHPVVRTINTNSNSTGTAFVVKSELCDGKYYKNIAISCEHGSISKFKIGIQNYNDQFYYDSEELVHAILLGKNVDHDLSVLMFLSDRKMKCAEMNFTTNFKLREKVFGVGLGLKDSARFSDGVITGLAPSRRSLINIRTTICMVPGDSGGPLFNSDYQVIGVANNIKTMNNNNQSYPVTNISTFKSIDLIQKLFKNGKFDFIFEDKELPSFLSDYLWVTDLELID